MKAEPVYIASTTVSFDPPGYLFPIFTTLLVGAVVSGVLRKSDQIQLVSSPASRKWLSIVNVDTHVTSAVLNLWMLWDRPSATLTMHKYYVAVTAQNLVYWYRNVQMTEVAYIQTPMTSYQNMCRNSPICPSGLIVHNIISSLQCCVKWTRVRLPGMAPTCWHGLLNHRTYCSTCQLSRDGTLGASVRWYGSVHQKTAKCLNKLANIYIYIYQPSPPSMYMMFRSLYCNIVLRGFAILFLINVSIFTMRF